MLLIYHPLTPSPLTAIKVNKENSELRVEWVSHWVKKDGLITPVIRDSNVEHVYICYT